nr:ribonuclease H-like domain-containing protein [Tanacetum cinerariifolium]
MPISHLPLTHDPTTPNSTPNTHITSPAATAYGNTPNYQYSSYGHPCKSQNIKTLSHMNCHATTTLPIPRSHLHALRDPNWHKAMRSLYGPKQPPQAWFQRFASFITRVGFQYSKTDTSLFAYHKGSDVAYLLLYVDDIVLTASSTALLQRIITLLHSEFAMADLEILERAHMQHCNPCKTLVDTESKLGYDGDPVSGPTLYRSLAGALQHLTFTRPDISCVVQQIYLYMHDPRDPHFTALKRILRYVRGTIDHGVQLHVSFTSQLTAYTDADWVGCPVTRRCCKCCAETAWLRNLLLELHAPLSTATLVYCDNVKAAYLSTNLVQHQRTKHIEIDIHFFREYVASVQVRVLHVTSRFQYAYVSTKGLSTTLFLEFRLTFEDLPLKLWRNIRCHLS